PRHARGRRRAAARSLGVVAAACLLAAGTAAAVAGLLHSRSAAGLPGPQPAAAARSLPAVTGPAIALAGARRLVAAFLAADNAANQARSDTGLAAIEGGSSYLMHAGTYQSRRVSDPSNLSYQPLRFTVAGYYIPVLTGFPRWFAVAGRWLGTEHPATAPAWLVYRQASPGARWLEIFKPYITAAAPHLPPAAGPGAPGGGYATAVSPGTAAALAAAPGSLPAATAASLDRGPPYVPPGLGGLLDERAQVSWRARLPAGSTVTDRHRPAGNGVYALRTAGGGALVFCDLSASLTLAAPPGRTMRLDIPGYYSPARPVSSATVPYVDQVAIYEPPAGAAAPPQLIADASGTAVTQPGPG
ncbi:MAG TPA: hypothetical protein VGN41_00260, partial [Streptosporangiaceae bacterium]